MSNHSFLGTKVERRTEASVSVWLYNWLEASMSWLARHILHAEHKSQRSVMWLDCDILYDGLRLSGL